MKNNWNYIIYGWLIVLTIGGYIITTYLSEKNNIIETNSRNPEQSFKYDNNYTPFIQYPNNGDSIGNLTLTKEQLENIKNHIEYLNRRVDGAINDTKQEISNDINRLNAWAAWWLAGLAVIAGLIPFLLNFLAKLDIDKAFDHKFNEAKEKANEAFNNSEQAKREIKDAKNKLDEFENKYKGLDKTTEEAKNNAEKALENSSISNQNAQEAKNAANEAKLSAEKANNKADAIEKLMKTSDALSKLRMLDIKKMEFIPNHLKYYIGQMELIEQQLRSVSEQNDDFFSNDIVKDNIQAFFISHRSFRTLFSEREVTKSILEFHSFMEEVLKKGVSKNIVNAITEKLTELLQKIKKYLK